MESPRRGEIYFVDFSPTGTGEMAGRHPALVIQNDIGNRASQLTIVAAITATPASPGSRWAFALSRENRGCRGLRSFTSGISTRWTSDVSDSAQGICPRIGCVRWTEPSR